MTLYVISLLSSPPPPQFNNRAIRFLLARERCLFGIVQFTREKKDGDFPEWNFLVPLLFFSLIFGIITNNEIMYKIMESFAPCF